MLRRVVHLVCTRPTTPLLTYDEAATILVTGPLLCRSHRVDRDNRPHRCVYCLTSCLISHLPKLHVSTTCSICRSATIKVPQVHLLFVGPTGPTGVAICSNAVAAVSPGNPDHTVGGVLCSAPITLANNSPQACCLACAANSFPAQCQGSICTAYGYLDFGGGDINCYLIVSAATPCSQTSSGAFGICLSR